MGSLFNKLRRFMYGRYGYDQFSRFLFLFSIVFWALSIIFRYTPLRGAYFVFWILNTLIYAFALFRIFSKNIYRRTVENEKYLRIRGKIFPKWLKFKNERLNRDYVFKACPYCAAKLRLRRKKGKHNTRCPRCGTEFTIRIFFGN